MDTANVLTAHAAGETDVVERARQGDQAAFIALVDARLAMTYRMALAFLGNESDARAATEEAFLRVWRDLPQLAEPLGFETWFGGIVDETCRTAMRDRGRGSGGDTSARTQGTLRQQILDRVAATGQESRPLASEIELSPVLTGRRAHLGRWILVAGLLTLGLAVFVGLRFQPPPPPFRTGLVAFIRDGDLHLAKADGTGSAVVVHQDGVALSTVAWSPGGRRIAIDGDAGALIYDTVTRATAHIGGRDPVWSPDGRQVAVIDDSDATKLRVFDVESGTATLHPFGSVGDLAWSPDGRWILAAGSPGDGGSGRSSVLLRLDLSTGTVDTIDPATRVGGMTRQPAWSPDSFRIAFSRRTTLGFGCDGTSLCGMDVYTANLDGTGVVQLNDPKTDADQPAWSPDGRWVAFRQIASATTAVENDPLDPDANVGLVIATPDLKVTRTLDASRVESFAWSVEGDRLRYVRSEGPGRPATLWEVSLDERVPKAQPLDVSIDPAARDYYYALAPHGVAWQSLPHEAAGPAMPAAPRVKPSPPAAAMAIETPPVAPPADPSASWPLLALESNDGCQPPQLLSTGDGTATDVGGRCTTSDGDIEYAWSPTGTHHARLDSGGRLSILDIDGTEHANLGGLTGLSSFSWSPAGSWLSLSGSVDQIIRVDGSGLRDLPGSPTWSPDDRHLSIGLPDGTLLVGDGDGTGLRSIGSFPPSVVWSADGSRLAFIRDGDAWIAAADGSDVRNVTAFPLGGASGVAWSPDDQWLAVSAAHGAWLMRPDGSERRGLVFGPPTSVGGVSWAPDASRLAVETYSNGALSPSIDTYLIDVDGSGAIRLDAASAAVWSPDGRYLAVAHANASTGGGFEIGNLELMNGDGSGRHELPVTTNGNWAVWVKPDR